jgi:hypothetical protein
MPLESNGQAPYTTAAAAIAAISAFRERGFSPITAEALVRAGVPETIAPRTLNSLKLLGLVGQDGGPSSQFIALRHARGDDEYEKCLQEWLRAEYEDVLKYANPSVDGPDRVAEAFRGYDPAGQRKSMAALLIGLWKFAGLPTPENAGGSERAKTPRATPGVRSRTSKAPTTPPPISRDRPNSSQASNALPPGLVGLLQQIPVGGAGWTKVTRDNFVNAFTAVLDFTVPVVANDLAYVDESQEVNSS